MTGHHADTLTDQDRQEILGMYQNALQNLLDGDIDSWVNHYDADCVFHPPNEPAVCGHDCLVAWGKAFEFEKMSWSNIEIKGCSELAYGITRVDFTLPGVGAVQAKQLSVLRKIDGQWKAVAAAFNADV